MRGWLAGVSKRRLVVGVILVAVASAGGGVAAFALLSSSNERAAAGPGETPTPTATSATTSPTSTLPPVSPTPTPIVHAGILDGAPLSDAEWAARKDLLPLAVMVDNSPGGYPQAGLDRADLVYEAFVEGGITRFMAVYWRQEAETIFPVRSARTPFVIWASELGALYGHAGGAITGNDANAIGQVYEWGIPDLDAFVPVSDRAYYRSEDRYAPYNLVGNTIKLRDAAKALQYTKPPTVESWPFKADGEGTAGHPLAGGFEINFQGSRYAATVIQWHWDPASKSWLRFQSGGAHKDAVSNQQISAKTVVVMRVPWDVVDFSGHVLYDQFGEGPATVFLDGHMIEGTWKKKDRLARTRFYDNAGREIAFNRGPIWIEVAGPQSGVTTAETLDALPPMPQYEPPPQYGPGDGGNDEEEVTPVAPRGSPSPSASRSPSPSASPNRSPSPSASPNRSPSPGASGTAAPSASASPGSSSTASPTTTASGTATAPPVTTPTPPAGTATTPAATSTASPTSPTSGVSTRGA